MDSIFTTLVMLTLVGTPPIATNTTASPYAILQVSEPDQLDLYVELLAFKESSGKEDVVIVDTNGKHSRGCLQFQDDTFQEFATKYQVSGPVMDCPTQKKLARLMLSNEPHLWKRWYNSVKKIGRLPPV